MFVFFPISIKAQINKCLSPLRLGQLSAQIIQKLFHGNIPENLQSLCPPMPEIFIDPNGIIKLLANLNPNKAAGPDYQTHNIEGTKIRNCSYYLPAV